MPLRTLKSSITITNSIINPNSISNIFVTLNFSKSLATILDNFIPPKKTINVLARSKILGTKKYLRKK